MSVCDTESLKHLNLLVQIIKSTYRFTSECLDSLLAKHKIMYDLLWTLFKVGQKVYSIFHRKSRCLIYDFDEEKETDQSMKYFELTCCYFDFDGEVFGEVMNKVQIVKFCGAV